MAHSLQEYPGRDAKRIQSVVRAKGVITGRQVGTLSFDRMKQLVQEALRD